MTSEAIHLMICCLPHQQSHLEAPPWVGESRSKFEPYVEPPKKLLPPPVLLEGRKLPQVPLFPSGKMAEPAREFVLVAGSTQAVSAG